MRLHLSLEDIRDTKHRGEIESLLRKTCARYDLSHATFLALRFNSSSKHNPFYFTTYPKAWVDTYVARNFFELDPLIGVSLAGLLPVDWEAVDRTDRNVSLFSMRLCRTVSVRMDLPFLFAAPTENGRFSPFLPISRSRTGQTSGP